MFNDMSVSRDLLERFKVWLEDKGHTELNGTRPPPPQNNNIFSLHISYVMMRCDMLIADWSPVDFSILVLATGSWPLQPPSTNFVVPKELQVRTNYMRLHVCLPCCGSYG
jgi:hypothetical protein